MLRKSVRNRSISNGEALETMMIGSTSGKIALQIGEYRPDLKVLLEGLGRC